MNDLAGTGGVVALAIGSAAPLDRPDALFVDVPFHADGAAVLVDRPLQPDRHRHRSQSRRGKAWKYS